MKKTSGYVLIATLLAIIIMTAITVLVASNATSEVRQSGGDQALSTTRAAAEAAQADAHYYLTNQGLTDINTGLQSYVTAFSKTTNSAANSPIIMSSSATVLTSLNALSGMNSISGTLNGANYTARVVFTDVIPDQSSYSTAGQTWFFNYKIIANATLNSYKRGVTTNGQLHVRLGRSYLNQFVLLADDGGWNNGSGGGYFGTGSTYDGPVHFNGDVAFAGTPAFQYGVTTNATTIAMYNCGKGKWENKATQSNDCTVPDLNGNGIQYGVPKVDMPTNAYSQQNAALGRGATVTTAPSALQECTSLGLTIFTTPPCNLVTGAPNGTYVPSSSSVMTGGIYVKGDAKVVLSTLPATPASQQVYAITDTNNITTTITVDYTAKTTTVVVPKYIAGKWVMTTTTLTGVPNGQVYSTGAITSLTGPARTGALPNPVPDTSVPAVVPPAIAALSQLNVAAASDVTFTGDVVYEQDPRSVPTASNVLGVISGTQNLHVGSTAPNDIFIQAALLSGASGKGLVVDGLGSVGYKGGIHLYGSTAEQSDGLRGIAGGTGGTLSSGYDDAFHFDKRFLNGGTVPPFYPATTVFQAQASWPDQQGWRECAAATGSGGC